MRVTVVITILMIVFYNNIEARRVKIPIREYINSVSISIHNSCNRKAYLSTNNEVIFNCFKVNTTNDDCSHLDNFTEYIDIKNKCSEENNSTIGSSLIICLLVLIYILLN